MSILSPQVEKLIQEMVMQGGFASADDVVRAGIALLQQTSLQGDFAAGEKNPIATPLRTRSSAIDEILKSGISAFGCSL